MSYSHLTYAQRALISSLDRWWREYFEERAAIREYDGGLPRALADAAAVEDVRQELDGRTAR